MQGVVLVFWIYHRVVKFVFVLFNIIDVESVKNVKTVILDSFLLQ